MKPFIPSNPSTGSFSIQEMLSQMSPSQHRLHHYEPPPPSTMSSFLNEQILLSAAALAASHSYPPPSSYLSSIAASNLLSSINAHFHSVTPSSSTNYFDDKKDYQDQQILPTDVKNLIESSLTAIGLDNVDDNDFIKAATNKQNTNDLFIDDDMDSFERSTTPATNTTSPIHLLTSTTKQITRPVNIPNTFSNDYFSHSSSTNQLFDETLGSVCSIKLNLYIIIFIFSQLIHYFLNHQHPVAIVVDLVNFIKWLVLVKIYLHHLNQCFNVLIQQVQILQHHLLRKWI
jgi:hypothetical protein